MEDLNLSAEYEIQIFKHLLMQKINAVKELTLPLISQY